MCSVENHKIDPVAEEKQAESRSYERVENIRSQLLGGDDYEIDKENGEPEEDSVAKKEKLLDEKLKIDNVFRMVSKIYRNMTNVRMHRCG